MSSRKKQNSPANSSFIDNGYEELDNFDRAGYVTHDGVLFFGEPEKLPKGYKPPAYLLDNNIKPDMLDDIQKHVDEMLKQEKLMEEEYDRAVAAELGKRASPSSKSVSAKKTSPKSAVTTKTPKSNVRSVKTPVNNNNSEMNNVDVRNVVVSVKTKSKTVPKTVKKTAVESINVGSRKRGNMGRKMKNEVSAF